MSRIYSMSMPSLTDTPSLDPQTLLIMDFLKSGNSVKCPFLHTLWSPHVPLSSFTFWIVTGHLHKSFSVKKGSFSCYYKEIIYLVMCPMPLTSGKWGQRSVHLETSYLRSNVFSENPWGWLKPDTADTKKSSIQDGTCPIEYLFLGQRKVNHTGLWTFLPTNHRYCWKCQATLMSLNSVSVGETDQPDLSAVSSG